MSLLEGRHAVPDRVVHGAQIRSRWVVISAAQTREYALQHAIDCAVMDVRINAVQIAESPLDLVLGRLEHEEAVRLLTELLSAASKPEFEGPRARPYFFFLAGTELLFADVVVVLLCRRK